LIHKEDDWYVADCPEVGTVSQGKTVEEAVANLKEATEIYLEEFPVSETNHPLLTCAGYLSHLPGFVRLYNNFITRYDPNLRFRHIMQKPKYKKTTFEGRFLSSLVQKVTFCGPDGDRTRGA
jgi:predicted RNase H-like HicB family nuclease